ncbi:MAG: hypothetical protein K6C97_11275 [Treponema sp.]|nr:hypothetical protein [Treponema sp.]
MTFDLLNKKADEIIFSKKDQNKKIIFKKIMSHYGKGIKDFPEAVYALYKLIKDLSFKELQNLFPSKKGKVEQSLLDCQLHFFSEQYNENDKDKKMIKMGEILGELFDSKSLKEIQKQPSKDLRLLQYLFFFLIMDLLRQNQSQSNELNNILQELYAALDNGNWKETKFQTLILNKLASCLEFNQDSPFENLDFYKFKDNRFSANSSILNVLYYFSRPAIVQKESIINELNFIRTQQSEILPCIINKKSTFTNSQANSEIKSKKLNLDTLKSIDKGFKVNKLEQESSINIPKFNNKFIRDIECKCFKETNSVWEAEPRFDNKSSKIKYDISLRSYNKDALRTKFLYSERNVFTHSGDHYAIYQLFMKDNSALVLESLYDIREYLHNRENSQYLLNIANEYFKLLVSNLPLKSKDIEGMWEEVFDHEGLLNIKEKDFEKNLIYTSLTETQVKFFKNFISFMYTTENLKEDFIASNCLKIQIYLIYITFEFSRIDAKSA